MRANVAVRVRTKFAERVRIKFADFVAGDDQFQVIEPKVGLSE